MIRSIVIVSGLAVVAAASVAFVTSCSPAERVVDTSCSAFAPITYSAKGDTEETKSQIRGHNAAWVRLCGK